MQSIRIEEIKTPPGFIEEQVVKKSWLNPEVIEISKFSILSGINNTKFEVDGVTFVAS
jgi:hypothetical protein